MSDHHGVVFDLQYCPPISFFRVLLDFEVLYLEAYENYQKKSYRNRCKIAGPHGVQVLSVPLEKGKNRQTHIKDVNISNDQLWQKKHWHALESAYRNSPYFEHYEWEIKPFFDSEYEKLFELNLSLLKKLTALLGLEVELDFTIDFHKTHSGEALDAAETILPNENKWWKRNSFPHYRQVFSEQNGFIPDLSILDLIFNKGPESILYLRQIKSPEYDRIDAHRS